MTRYGINYTDYFDIYRYLFGIFAITFVITEPIAPKRKDFQKKLVIVSLLLVILGFSYILLRIMQSTILTGSVLLNAVLALIYWNVMYILVFAMMYHLFQISLGALFYYGVIAQAIEGIMTGILQYVVIRLMFPGLVQEHPYYYILVALIFYAIVLSILYPIARYVSKKNFSADMEMSPLAIATFLTILFIMKLMTAMSSYIFEWGFENAISFGSMEMYSSFVVPFFCVVTNILICFVVIIAQVSVYRIVWMTQEKKLLELMQKQKEQQYQFSKENMDLINAKCHDLKHQIRALENVGEADRKRLFEETEKAISFYDASIHTGHEVLDTILTEKSINCTAHDIRMTSNVQIQGMKGIELIDLCTILGNALDNAIECVMQYQDTEKRVISLTIKEKNGMLTIFVDNYFDGVLKMNGEVPVTSKEKEKGYHGFGVKSIQMIVKKYHGKMRISTENRTFSLQIMMEI